MLILSKNKLDELKSKKYRVYSKEYLSDGVECFNTSESLGDSFYISFVEANHIKCENNKFYYTEESLSDVADFWPKHLLPVIGAFSSKKSKSNTKQKGTSKLSKSFIVDASGLPAFSGIQANEDLSVNEYRFYLTLFNEYTVKQCQYERHSLYDARVKSSKYDLPSRLQNSNFLKSKDFKVINYKRQESETVPVGLIIKENKNGSYEIEYGTVLIDMNNKISIIWH